ncbi:hypothetical protein BD779DRAFT_1482722 [Infundibulicybe gibba]|nr:hypothetical protein BD779DRAFT_1482722 [Infundibulicybe gibba]
MKYIASALFIISQAVGLMAQSCPSTIAVTIGPIGPIGPFSATFNGAAVLTKCPSLVPPPMFAAPFPLSLSPWCHPELDRPPSPNKYAWSPAIVWYQLFSSCGALTGCSIVKTSPTVY